MKNEKINRAARGRVKNAPRETGAFTNSLNTFILFTVIVKKGTVFFLVILLLSGCSSFGGKYGEAAYDGFTQNDEYRAAPAPSSAPSMAKQAAPASGEFMDMAETEQMVSSPEAAPPEQPVQRLRVYSGFSRLIVEDPDETREKVSALAEDNGGYVEGIWGNVIVVRVPVDLFAELFERILALGQVDFKKIETVDVTEYFTDLSTRLSIAEKTRGRLYGLLEKTDDVEERLKILREIRRLTEEIESIRNTLASLEKMIAFSRIQVELIPRLSGQEALKAAIPFGWIGSLNPLYPSLEAPPGKPEVPLDDSFAVFSEDALYRAEDHRGVRVRISGTANVPVGDTAFWQEALFYHLSPLYAEARRMEFQQGGVKGVLLTSKDTEPFHYLVAQTVSGSRIAVFEVFFPDTAALNETKDRVFTALDGTVLK